MSGVIRLSKSAKWVKGTSAFELVTNALLTYLPEGADSIRSEILEDRQSGMHSLDFTLLSDQDFRIFRTALDLAKSKVESEPARFFADVSLSKSFIEAFAELCELAAVDPRAVYQG